MKTIKRFFRKFKKIIHNIGQTLSTIINSALLFIVYFIGVGFTSIFAKAFGKKFLKTKILKKQKSYWSDLNLKKKPIQEFYRQF